MNTETNKAEFSNSQREKIAALRRFRHGDFTVRLPEPGQGTDPEFTALFNSVVSLNQQMAGELERIARRPRQKSGRKRRARIAGAEGGWAVMLQAINTLIEREDMARGDKPEPVTVTSRHTPQSLANLSHELRTPLSPLLILSKMLADNAEGNLTEKQVEFAQTIHSAGTDLAALVNDILDLAKIGSGTAAIEIGEVSLVDLGQTLEQTFRQLAVEKALRFDMDLADDLPATIRTDGIRLRQIARNLLSNAFKFTASGGVVLAMDTARSGWSRDHPVLGEAGQVIRIVVADSGIGIPPHQQQLVFEAFRQADETTSREYGGTGLGLSISREIAGLLGGEIRLSSAVGQGSTFTLYIPAHTPEPPPRPRPARRGSAADAGWPGPTLPTPGAA